MHIARTITLATTLVACALGAACSTPVIPGTDGGNARKVLSTDRIYPAIGPYSQMVSHGGTLYVSGVLPLNLAGNAMQGGTIEEQTRVVLTHIGEKLKSQGLGYEDVLMSTVYMKDLNEFAAMNKVYGEFFKSNAPARATVQVARIPRDALIEISVIAGRR